MRPWLTRNVVALGIVSLLTDSSSEMIVPFLPAFIATTLGGGALAVGGIEGAAEATASLLKLISGRWSDRGGRRNFVLFGYSLSALARPLIAIATSPWHVLGVRMLDRTGKGIRTSPRDALLALAVPLEHRGAAYGFHRAMDHLGAVIGPAAALAILYFWPGDLRRVFAWAILPGMLSVVAILLFVREEPVEQAPTTRPILGDLPSGPLLRFLAPVALFQIGRASDAFLLLKVAGDATSMATAPLLWIAFHLVKTVLSTPMGIVADRIGRRATITAGWILCAAVYIGFALATSPTYLTVLFVVYGAYHALTEGAEKALVAELAPPDARGTAFGWYHLVVGVIAIPAGVVFGALWDVYSPAVAFGWGATVALVAATALLALRPEAE